MPNDYFEFRQFIIRQDRCAMKVGTDGVLLGAWANLNGTERILDAGAGTGLIAIMCAQRSKALIDAIEIDPHASDQAVENSLSSPWKDRITVYSMSFQQFSADTRFEYDLILSNPPYFRNSLKPPDSRRSVARHDDRLDITSLIHYTVRLLKPTGRLAVILPFDQAENFISLAWINGLYVSKRTAVRPYPGKNCTRILIECGREQSANPETDEIMIRKGEKDDYTDDYRALMSAFYLKV